MGSLEKVFNLVFSGNEFVDSHTFVYLNGSADFFVVFIKHGKMLTRSPVASVYLLGSLSVGPLWGHFWTSRGQKGCPKGSRM